MEADRTLELLAVRRKTLEAFAGIEHDSCCIAWRVLARHYVHNVERESTNALYFELEFKGVGSIGQRTGISCVDRCSGISDLIDFCLCLPLSEQGFHADSVA